jgi:hypothetical protein
VIEAMTPPQGRLSIESLCTLAGVSRATYYRHWHVAAPRTEETALRDVLQRLAVAHRHYGYRRLTELVRREGWAAPRRSREVDRLRLAGVTQGTNTPEGGDQERDEVIHRYSREVDQS